MNVLMILTSHDRLGDTGKPTGFWLEELAAPYYVLKDAGVTMTLASPDGGQPPLDPVSANADAQTDDTRRFDADPQAKAALAATRALVEIDPEQFDAVFFPGGHGPLWDLAEDETVRAIVEAMIRDKKPVAAVCHAPAVFRHAETEDGEPLVKGRHVTGFSNSEEAAVGLTDIVPFLVEDMLTERGGIYSKTDDWGVHVLRDGLLITGQNPASSAETARKLLDTMR